MSAQIAKIEDEFLSQCFIKIPCAVRTYIWKEFFNSGKIPLFKNSFIESIPYPLKENAKIEYYWELDMPCGSQYIVRYRKGWDDVQLYIKDNDGIVKQKKGDLVCVCEDGRQRFVITEDCHAFINSLDEYGVEDYFIVDEDLMEHINVS